MLSFAASVIKYIYIRTKKHVNSQIYIIYCDLYFIYNVN
jgi:hypothetical protein